MAEFCFSPQKPPSLREVDLRSKDGGSFPAATSVDVPTGWDPNTKKEPTGLFFAACGRPCSFDSSYGLHDTATTVDVPTGWDPRANQSPTGALVTVLCTAALFDSRMGHEKNPPSECSRDFMTRTGIEPMLQP